MHPFFERFEELQGSTRGEITGGESQGDPRSSDLKVAARPAPKSLSEILVHGAGFTRRPAR
jgi:hypothetical protein